MAARNATYGYIDVNVETAEVATGLGDCIHQFVRKNVDHHGRGRLYTRYVGSKGRWDGSKFYTNFQVARVDYGRSSAYRQLFDHVDSSGGIYRHRWGADPFMFLAATLLLDEGQIVHFSDVAYMHQHLVCNLPAAFGANLSDAYGASPGGVDEAEEEAAAEAEAAKAAAAEAAEAEVAAWEMARAGGASASSSPVAGDSGGQPPALLYIGSAAQAAAAADFLARWDAPRTCRLTIRPLLAHGLGDSDRDLVHRILGQADLWTTLAVLPSIEVGGDGGGDVHVAGRALFHVGAMLRPWQQPAAARLVMVCIDETDGATLAVALAARLARALAVLNVCDAHAPVTDSGGGDDELMRALAPASLPAAPLPLSSAARACAARRHHAAGHLLPAAEHAVLCAAAQCNLEGA